MNKETKEIKDILRLHGVTISKPEGEWIVNVLIDGYDKVLLYIGPETEDAEWLRLEDLDDVNNIIHFDVNFEEFHSKDMTILHRHLSAIQIALEFVKELNREWTGKDVREFATLNIAIRK